MSLYDRSIELLTVMLELFIVLLLMYDTGLGQAWVAKLKRRVQKFRRYITKAFIVNKRKRDIK